jgi:hypothetical protein
VHDLSFVIPIRVDTPDRLENCGAILRFLTRYFPDSEIQLVEQDLHTQTGSLREMFPHVVWHFEADAGYFSRGRAINTGLLKATRRVVCAYDTDILIDPRALRTSCKLILENRWPIVIPFNLIFVEVSGERRAALIDSLDIQGLCAITRLSHVPRQPEIASRILSGAIMACDRETVLMEGGYNRKMVSYGWEDIEFFKRFEKLGYYSYMLSSFNLIHLDHRRGPDSRVNEMYDVNKREFDRVVRMSPAELRAYVDTELALSPSELGARSHRRRRQASTNLLRLRRPVHFVNKVATHLRINGAGKLLGRLVPAWT